jgi:transcriptional regulator with XRE-family HTH domain
MLGKRLKQLRLAKGLSLDELVAQSGGIVTKQAISKYEQGKAQPSPRVLARLAGALGSKVAQLVSEPTVEVEVIAYRKASGLRKKEQNRVENLVRQTLEDRIRLQKLIAQNDASDIPIKGLRVRSLEDAEDAASELRNKWNLGRDPIANVMNVLENHRVHILEIEASEKFDGISAVAYLDAKKIAAAAVVIRHMDTGERQRLNLTHELGHLVLKIDKEIDEEKAAFRFGAAFLAPKEFLFREIGTHRSVITIAELLHLQARLGMSIQALLYRFKDLQIINDLHFAQWFKQISRLSWRKKEPNTLPPEKPEWLRQNVLRAFVEGILSHEEAEVMLGEKIEDQMPLSLVKRKNFMKLPLEERRRLMVEQAEKLASHYEEETDWKDLGSGDFSDDKP